MIKTSELKNILYGKRITQTELAERTGVRAATINAIANDRARHLPLYAVDRICEELECEPQDFIKRVKK